MKKLIAILTIIFLCSILGACFKFRQELRVGIIDTQRIMAQWPKFRQTWIDVQREGYQLFQSINKNKTTISPTDREAVKEASEKWQKVKEQLTDEARGAAIAVAKTKKLQMVVVNSGVEFGGEDITEDVLKLLK